MTFFCSKLVVVMKKRFFQSRPNQTGQAVLVILLIISVLLVVGLSIASRSVTDIKISQQSQEAARALWVAQAGLEEAIKTNSTIGVGTTASLGGIKYSVTKTGIGGANDFVFPGNFLPEDEQAILSLTGYSGNITFYWGKEGTPNNAETTPALEMILIYESGGKYLAKRYVYDPNSGRDTPTKFDGHVNTANCSTGGMKFAFCSNPINLPSGDLRFARLKLLFNDVSQPIGVSGNAKLPPQGSCYESTATVPESGVARKLQQCQLTDTTPAIFDYVLFSGKSITQ